MRADTSTEIALNFAGWPRRSEWTRGVRVVTNNHFDADGVLSVWTVLKGERATGLRDKLVAAAEAGDFSEFRHERAVRVAILLQGGETRSSRASTRRSSNSSRAARRWMRSALTNWSCPKSSAC